MQIAFNLHAEEDWEKSYIIGQANASLYRSLILERQFAGINPYNTIILLYGKKYSGKTHLANIWKKRFNAVMINNAHEIFADNKHIICEDIHLMDPVNLFHIFNTVNNNNIRCLMTTSEYPYTSNLKDAESRIRSIKSIELPSITIDMIQGIFIKLLNQHNIKYTDFAIKSISSKLPNDILKIYNIVKYIYKLTVEYNTLFNSYICNLKELQDLL